MEKGDVDVIFIYNNKPIFLFFSQTKISFHLIFFYGKYFRLLIYSVNSAVIYGHIDNYYVIVSNEYGVMP